MPVLQNLVLTDRTPTTPVSHTFTPRGKEGMDGGRVVAAGASALADRLFTIEPRVTPGGRRKVAIRLVIPVVQTQTINGVSSFVVVRTARAMAEFDFANDTTEQERRDIVGMLQSSFDSSKVLVNDVLTKPESVW